MAGNTFTAGDGLISFVWSDALNWSAGVPVAGQDVSLAYNPGFGYAITSGTTLVGADQNPAITFGTLIFDTANATLDVAANMTFGTLDLKAGTIEGSGNFGLAPVLSGTFIDDGGILDLIHPLYFQNAVWLGDLTIASDGQHFSTTEFFGSLSVGPAPGGARPVFTLGNLVPLPFGAPATSLSIDHDLSGFDVVLLGQATLANATGIAADSVLQAISGVNDLTFAAFKNFTMTNAGQLVVSGGTLYVGPPSYSATSRSTLTNSGTIAISGNAMLQTGSDLEGAGTIRIGSGGTLWLASFGQNVGMGQTIALQDATATIVSLATQPEGSITGFRQGDRIVAYDPYGFVPSLSYTAGVLTVTIGTAITQFYIGQGYDPASFSATISDTSAFGNGAAMAVITTTTVAPPSPSPFVPPVNPGGTGPDIFTASLGLFNFDWNAAGNWSSAVPGAAIDASVTFAPGYPYRINVGKATSAPSSNPAFTFNTLTLDAPGATLAVNADMNFGTLDLKAGILSPQDSSTANYGAIEPLITGTIIADGGQFDFIHGGGLWNGVTWVGDLTIANGTAAQVMSGGLTFEPHAGEARPHLYLGGGQQPNGSFGPLRQLLFAYPTVISGVDVTIDGGDLLFNRATDSPLPVGSGTIAADTTIHATSGGGAIEAVGNSYQGPSGLGQIVNDGLILADGGSIGFASGVPFDPLAATLTNNGTIDASNGGVVSLPLATSGTGAIHVASGATLFVENTIATGQSITLDDATASLWVVNASLINTHVHGFRQGDTITVTAISTADTASVVYSNGILAVTTGYGTTRIPIGPGYDPASFHVTVPQKLSSASPTPHADVTTTSALPCFAAGTRILTLRGEVAVERLRLGDMVPGPDGVGQAIVWLGHRSLACARHPRPQDVWPVRVRAGAFGEGLPARDLRLSPDHAVFVDGVLIPVRYLVNGATIVQERAARVTYWHVEFARHGVMLAEGLPCESYLDTGNRGAFANGGAVVQQHPDFALAIWATVACAPLVRDGEALLRVRAMLAGQAAGRGFRRVAAWDGTVLAGGRAIAPRMIAGALHRYALPADTREVRVVSPVGGARRGGGRRRRCPPARPHGGSSDAARRRMAPGDRTRHPVGGCRVPSPGDGGRPPVALDQRRRPPADRP